MRFMQTVTIGASARHVWSVLSEIQKWHEWTPTILSVQNLTHLPIGAGSRFRLTQPKLPVAEWKITVWEPGSGFEWETKSLGVKTRAKHWIRTVENGVELRLEVEYSGLLSGLVGIAAGRLTKSYLAQESTGLKRRCEDVTRVV